MVTLADSIVSTISFFDCFDYPLTTFEVWKWLWQADSQEAVTYASLEDALQKNERVAAVGPFWVITGRQELVATRMSRERLSIKKLDIARRFTRILRFIPGITGVAACNSLGYRNARASSDIDLFIITEPRTIWFARFVATAVAKLLRMRPNAKNHADGICLSFWISRDHLSLESLALPGGDPYLVYWTTQLIPLLTRGSVWQEFWQANDWVKRCLPNAVGPAIGASWFEQRLPKSYLPVKIAQILESYSRRWQEVRLPKSIKNSAKNNSTAVVVNDHMLKFHDNDQRVTYRERWLTIINQIKPHTPLVILGLDPGIQKQSIGDSRLHGNDS